MSDPAGWVLEVKEHKGVEEAFAEACKEIRNRDKSIADLWNSRFFERRILEDGSKKLWPVTEHSVSAAYDMQDCIDEPLPEFLYCDEDGQLYPITIGTLHRHEANPDGPDEIPFNYGSSAMIANNKVVGYVNYTDH